MEAATDLGIYIGFRIMISQPLNKDTYRTTRNVAWDYGYVWVMCSVRKGGKLYFDMVKKGERKMHRLIICRNANTQQGIVTWPADLSLDEPAQLTSRAADFLCHHKQIYLHVVFVTVSSDCGWETLSHCHKDTDWMCLNVLTKDTSTNRNFDTHATESFISSYCTVRVLIFQITPS